MAHVKLESPRASPGMTNELFKLIDGGKSPGSGEKKGLFSSFWKKPKLGKLAMRNEFEHQALDGPSYSNESEKTESDTNTGDTGDAWNLESRDDNDDTMWGFDTKTSREEIKSKDNGFPPLPPIGSSKLTSVKAELRDSSHSRQANPKVMVKRTPKKETNRKPKDFSLTQMISQSFDSEAAEDVISINSQTFSFSEPPTEYTQLDLSGEATKFVRQDDGYQVQTSPKILELDRTEAEDIKRVDEEPREEAALEVIDADLVKLEIDSDIPSFKDRLAFYKTRSKQNSTGRPTSPQTASEKEMKSESGDKSEVHKVRKVEPYKSQTGNYCKDVVKSTSDGQINVAKPKKDEQVKPNDKNISTLKACLNDDKDSSVQDRIKKFQPGFQGKSSCLGPGKGEQLDSSATASAPTSSVQARSHIITKASHPNANTILIHHRRSWSVDRRIATSSGHSKMARNTAPGGAAPFKKSSTLDRWSRSSEEELEPPRGMATKPELSSMPTLAQRKAAFLSSDSFDSSDRAHRDSVGSQRNDKGLSRSKSLRLSDTSKGVVAIEGKTIGGKRISIIRQTGPPARQQGICTLGPPGDDSTAIGDEQLALKRTSLRNRKSDVQGGRVKALRNSIESTDQVATSNSVQQSTRTSPTNLYKKAAENLKTHASSFRPALHEKKEPKCTQSGLHSVKSDFPVPRKQSFKARKADEEQNPHEGTNAIMTYAKSRPSCVTLSADETLVSIADRKKVFMSNVQEPSESTDLLPADTNDSTSSNRNPVARLSKVLNPKLVIQEKDGMKSEQMPPDAAQSLAVADQPLSFADRMKAFGCKVDDTEPTGGKKGNASGTLNADTNNLTTVVAIGKKYEEDNDLTVLSINGRLMTLADRKKSLESSFLQPTSSTCVNDQLASRRSLSSDIENASAPKPSMVPSASKTLASALNESNVLNKPPAPAQAQMDQEGKMPMKTLSTPTEPKAAIEVTRASLPPEAQFKSIVDRQKVFGSTVAPKSSNVLDDPVSSQQTKTLTPQPLFKLQISSSSMGQSGDSPKENRDNDEPLGQSDKVKEAQTVGDFTSSLRFFKSRSSSAILDEKRPIMDDPSATSTRVGTFQRVPSDGDHPLYVVVDGASVETECLSPSPRLLDRKIVLEPGKGLSYFECLQPQTGVPSSPMREEPPTENGSSSKLPPAWRKSTPVVEEKEPTSVNEDSSTVEKYQSVKSRFSQKTLPWRQQNAAGRYLERKKNTAGLDSQTQPDHPSPIKLPARSSELFCPISHSPITGPAGAATPTMSDFPASSQSPFGTPVNGYTYGNATPI